MRLTIRESAQSKEDYIEVWLQIDAFGNIDVYSTKNGECELREATFCKSGKKYFVDHGHFKEGDN